MFICSLRPKAIVKKLLFLAVIAAAIFLLHLAEDFFPAGK